MNSHRDFNNFEMMGEGVYVYARIHPVIFLDEVLKMQHVKRWKR